jgi:hypothetical protein
MVRLSELRLAVVTGVALTTGVRVGSQRMKSSSTDRADAQKLNVILWKTLWAAGSSIADGEKEEGEKG